jgi:bacteriocin-like protein
MKEQQTTDVRELTDTELNEVTGGTPFYGMNCSQNQHELIGAIAGAVGSIPVIGGFLSGVVTAVGRAICS